MCILSAQELEKYARAYPTGYLTVYAESNGVLVNSGIVSDFDRGKCCYWICGNHEGQPSSCSSRIMHLVKRREMTYNNYRIIKELFIGIVK